MSDMSWAQPPPLQRYSSVPGFEMDPRASASIAASANTSRSTTPVPDQSYELNDLGDPSNLPPAHRASLYSDPFVGGSPNPSPSAALLSDNDSMYSNNNIRPSHNDYTPMDSPRMASGNGQYGNQYPVGHGTQGATADDLWAMEGGNTASRHMGDEKYAPRGDHGGRSGGSKKWLWIGLIALLLCIGVGVGVGVGVTQANKKSGNSSGSSSGGSNTLAGDDPSVFDKDDRLKKSFWGLAYSPKYTVWPDCWANQSMVNRDMQLLSQLTTRLRLYGAMCNTTALVLQAIKDTKVDMKIWPAIYIDSNTTAYDVQVDALQEAFTTYGVDNVEGVAVGNEYILIQMTASGLTSVTPQGAAYTKAVATLGTFIDKFRSSLSSWNLGKTIKVGTGDAGALMSTTLAPHIDYFMANVHPWFAGTTVQDAATWTWQYFEETDVAPAEASPNKPDTYIAETGWPTGSSPPTSENGETRPTTDATTANLQIFLDEYVCQANQNGTKYFYFEPFDEEWKDKRYGGVEGYWGLFDKDRNLKDIKIPDCPPPS